MFYQVLLLSTLWLHYHISRLRLILEVKELVDFIKNPSYATHCQALDSCMPYYFPSHTMEKGRQFFRNIPYSIELAKWWGKR